MTTNAERIGFVGAGRVAQTLAAAFAQAGGTVAAASSRRPEALEALGKRAPGVRAVPQAQDVADACTLVFLTVGDDAIAAVCDAIDWRPGVGVVHCSGATPLAALSSAAAAGAEVGGFHPLQMFANPEVALAGLRGCAIGIEAAAGLHATLTALARAIGGVPFTIPPGQRAVYHASANYVGPFLIALLREAVTMWQRFGADEREALAALLPLLRGTVDAVVDDGLARGMGGCVARGDVGTVRAHLHALDALDADAARLYRELTRRTIPLGLERGTLSPAGAEAIAAALAAPPDAPAPPPALNTR